jgi:hypothetical protein
MTKDEIKGRLCELSIQIKDASRKLSELRDEHSRLSHTLAELNTPYKIGDRVIQKGVLYELVRIAPGYSQELVELYGAKIKKDGTLGVLENRLDEYWDGPITPAPPAT